MGADVVGHFDGEAERYDGLIRRLVAGYDEQNDAVAAALTSTFGPDEPLRVLDLGCGTGVLSELVLSAFPRARVRALDLSPRMIDQCRGRLAPFGERADCEVADFASAPLGEGYDAVVSGLATHHLPEDERPRLYERVAAALRPGGLFVNREVVLGETPEETEQLYEMWRRFMRANGEDAHAWHAQHLAEDHAVPASVELAWLDAAGFRCADVVWRGGLGAVLRAEK